jgi:hypothetical protein
MVYKNYEPVPGKTIEAHQLTQRYSARTPNGDVNGQSGDYLLRDGDGEHIVNKLTFETYFQEVQPVVEEVDPIEVAATGKKSK